MNGKYTSKNKKESNNVTIIKKKVIPLCLYFYIIIHEIL